MNTIMNLISREWGHFPGIRIAITPAHNNLSDLLDSITDSNIHCEVTTGYRAGKEIW